MAFSTIRSYRDLKVWQESMNLAEDCYVLTRSFPKEEIYGMISQIRRAGVSVAANIAEGYGRDSTGHYSIFLRHAQGSLKELETRLLISVRVGLLASVTADNVLNSCERIGKMLGSLIRKIELERAAG